MKIRLRIVKRKIVYRANKIRELIKKKFGTYSRLADFLKVNRSTITKYINGTRKPDYHMTKMLEKALGCTGEDIHGPTESR